MAKNVGYNPIERLVRDGGVWYNDRHYTHDDLAEYEGETVLMDPVVDVDNDCFTGFQVYNSYENEICEISLEVDDG